MTAIKVSGNDACILEVNSETDFVAKNQEFKNLVDELAEHLLANKPATLEEAFGQKMSNGSTVEEFIKAGIAKIGEKLSLRRFGFNQDRTMTLLAHTSIWAAASVLFPCLRNNR